MPKVSMLSGSKSVAGGVVAVAVDGELLGHLDELVPGPGLGGLRGRIAHSRGVEQALVVVHDDRLGGGVCADGSLIVVVVVVGGLEPVRGLRILPEVRSQVPENALLGPQERLLLVEVAHVGRGVAGHHGADLHGVVRRDVLAAHLDVGVAFVERLDHLFDRFALERRPPEGEGQFHRLGEDGAEATQQQRQHERGDEELQLVGHLSSRGVRICRCFGAIGSNSVADESTPGSRCTSLSQRRGFSAGSGWWRAGESS